MFLRHSRESGNPGLGPRMRGDDGYTRGRGKRRPYGRIAFGEKGAGSMKTWFALLAILAALLLAGCAEKDHPGASDDDASGDDAGDDDTGADFTIDAGQMTVTIHRDPYEMVVAGPDGRTLVATPDLISGPIGGGINISPMPFLPHAFQLGEWPHGAWYYATDAYATEATEGGGTEVLLHAVGVDDSYDRRTISLVFASESPTHLVITMTVRGQAQPVYETGAYRLDPDERFLGLGLQYDAIDSRGTLRMMHLGIGVDLTDQIQNHAPMPFYVSSRGYGMFVEEKGPGYFDMGRATDHAYGCKFRTAELKTHVFYGPQPLDIIEQYTALTGRPPMIPDFLFGHLHWRNDNHDESEVYSDADGLRAHGVPTSSIMVDAPWQTCYSTFRFNECPTCQFRDARAVIDYVHRKGYAFYLWTAEFVNRACDVEAPGMTPDNSAEFDAARDAGYLVPLLGNDYEYKWWHDKGAMVNFLNPDAYAWYQGLAANVMEMGAQGFKMDGGEYGGVDVLGLRSLGVFGFGGYGDERTRHYDYRQAYHARFWDVARQYNGDLGISTVRTAVWGEQTHVSYFWPGDLDATWNTDLGLPADIVGGLTLGTAGFPYYGSNTGGFHLYGVNPELTARWAEYAAWRPIFESPRDGAQQLWEEYPDDIFQIYRDAAIRHTRLFPYMKAYALEATRTGHPIMRMLPLLYPDDLNTYGRDFDYLLGDWLLVAPIYEQGAVTREVYLPAGRWVNYWTGDAQDGPKITTVDAPLAVIPVFAKAGAIVPLLDASVQTLWPTDDPDVIDVDDAADRMWADLYPSGTSALTLADGTAFAMSQDSSGFTLAITGAPLARTYSLRAVPATFDAGKPASVTGPSGTLDELPSYADWDAAAKGWFWDAAKGDLWVRDSCAGGTFTVAE